MAKRKVISDSDDSDDNGNDFHGSDDEASQEQQQQSSSQLQTRNNDISQHLDAYPPQLPGDLQTAPSNSTGTTSFMEGLSGELRAAQRSLMETTPATSNAIDGTENTYLDAERSPIAKGLSSSQQCAGSPSMQEKGSRKRARSCGYEEKAEENEPRSSSSFISPSKSIVVATGAQKPHVVIPEGGSKIDDYDHSGEDGIKHGASSGKKRRKKTQHHGTEGPDELDAENMANIVPNENYNPRPSRSRSGRGDEDLFVPLDYSKRPEKAAKSTKKTQKKAKKGSDEVDLQHESEGRDSAAPTTKGRSEVPDVQHESILSQSEIKPASITGQKETDEVPHEEELAAKEEKAPKKARGRPKKASKVESKDILEDSPMDVPSERDQAPTGHTNGNKSTKGKGHKDEIADEKTESENDGQKPPDIQQNKSRSDPNKALQETCENERLLNGDSCISMEPPTPTKPTLPQPETPSRSSNAPPKGPSKHSPISNGKVSYRVGLSKRARIEPLLRMVRK